MTLILGVSTPQFAVLSSDRRVTTTRGQIDISQQDSAGKTFNLAGHHLVGFAGLARLDGKNMERWVSDVLAYNPPSEYRPILAQSLTNSFKRTDHPTQPHSMLGVGFRMRGGRLEPETWLVSNEANGGGAIGPEFVDSKFRSVALPPRHNGVRLTTVGHKVPTELFAHASAEIERLVRNDALAVGPVIELLLEVSREVARQSGGAVGESILVTTLPRTAYGDTEVQHYMGPVSEKDLRTLSLSFYFPLQFQGPGANLRYQAGMISPKFHLTSMIYRPGSSEKLPLPDLLD